MKKLNLEITDEILPNFLDKNSREFILKVLFYKYFFLLRKKIDLEIEIENLEKKYDENKKLLNPSDFFEKKVSYTKNSFDFSQISKEIKYNKNYLKHEYKETNKISEKNKVFYISKLKLIIVYNKFNLFKTSVTHHSFLIMEPPNTKKSDFLQNSKNILDKINQLIILKENLDFLEKERLFSIFPKNSENEQQLHKQLNCLFGIKIGTLLFDDSKKKNLVKYFNFYF